MMRSQLSRCIVAALCLVCALSALGGAEETAQAILRQAGTRGGIVVHLGCGDGRLTAALRVDEGFTVHGLAASAKDVEAARAHLLAQGLYGPVSVERLAGKALPYADGLIDLVVVEDRLGVPMAEILRVLVPGGVALAREGEGWRKTVKPPSPDTDEWSHYLHDAGNNAVANDSVVGLPRRLKWVAPPLWLRSHETASGVQAQVASGGRLFYIFDEGLIGIVDERLPERWSIVCRNAFNGKLLWKRPLPRWGWRQWAKERFEGKDWTTIRAARVSAPNEVQRRLVADGGRLYATLGFRAPLSILDAATGQTLATVKGTEPTHEILSCDGIVVAHVREASTGVNQRRGKKPGNVSTLVAVAGDTARVLWRKPAGAAIRSLMLAADGGKVFYLAGNTLACLDLKSGATLWQTAPKSKNGRTLVVSSGVVLVLAGINLDAYDAANGKLLWQKNVPPIGGGEAAVALVLQHYGQELAHAGLVVDDEDGAVGGRRVGIGICTLALHPKGSSEGERTLRAGAGVGPTQEVPPLSPAP
mgnify:CR=1 FL=1